VQPLTALELVTVIHRDVSPCSTRDHRGPSDPQSALTGKHPAVWRAMESLVKEFVGASPRLLRAGTASSLLF
jgi:hypothetical protein